MPEKSRARGVEWSVVINGPRIIKKLISLAPRRRGGKSANSRVGELVGWVIETPSGWPATFIVGLGNESRAYCNAIHKCWCCCCMRKAATLLLYLFDAIAKMSWPCSACWVPWMPSLGAASLPSVHCWPDACACVKRKHTYSVCCCCLLYALCFVLSTSDATKIFQQQCDKCPLCMGSVFMSCKMRKLSCNKIVAINQMCPTGCA